MLYKNKLELGGPYHSIDRKVLGRNVYLILIPPYSLYGRCGKIITRIKLFGL